MRRPYATLPAVLLLPRIVIFITSMEMHEMRNRLFALLLAVLTVSACGLTDLCQKTPKGYVRHCVRLLDKQALYADSPESSER